MREKEMRIEERGGGGAVKEEGEGQ